METRLILSYDSFNRNNNRSKNNHVVFSRRSSQFSVSSQHLKMAWKHHIEPFQNYRGGVKIKTRVVDFTNQTHISLIGDMITSDSRHS